MKVAAKQLPLVAGVLWDIRQEADALRQGLALALKKQDGLLKWYRVEVAATGAKHTVRMIPTGRLNRLLAAAQAAARDLQPVHRTAFAKGAKRIVWVQHFGKGSNQRNGGKAA